MAVTAACPLCASDKVGVRLATGRLITTLQLVRLRVKLVYA